MQPDGIWDGGKEYEFQINRISNSGDVTEPSFCK